MRTSDLAAEHVAQTLERTRDHTLALVDRLDGRTLHVPLTPILSPLVWDLGHIAAYEDLWAVHRLGGEPLLRPDLAEAYDAFETPRAVRGDIRILDYAEALAYLAAVRERTLAVLGRVGPDDLHELVVRHELQHTETMRQALFVAGHPGGRPVLKPRYGGDAEWIDVDGGPAEIGAGPDGWAFDNERPRHTVELAPFRITRTPITNATFMRFVEGGGYERREWWSDEGWSWKEEYDITHPEGWTGPDDAPVQHVSWFEADAFARSLGARLPSEEEWERAVTSNHATRLEGVGFGWEWTSSEFDGYPGFVAHPYPEYSEVFFRSGYRVLRGGSWATADRVATPTFRNWDLPQRRQIFTGLRLAADA